MTAGKLLVKSRNFIRSCFALTELYKSRNILGEAFAYIDNFSVYPGDISANASPLLEMRRGAN
ncbi:hypothetical protein AM228_05555 [Planktothricoides sp. SR001]|nr:hypothetical protein AM228_05555 [Planktothricoides sp. SR001]